MMIRNRYNRLAKLRLAVVLLAFAAVILGMISTPQKALAHASLVQAVPEANSKLKDSPAQISVTFNERLDEGLFYIKVLNSKGSEVTKSKAVMNPEHTGMVLALPKLSEGVYLVSYHVISEDGHPVGGSYPITVGNPPQEEKLQLPAGQVNHQHEFTGSWSNKIMIQYAVRGLWYLAVLALAGWVVWLRIDRRGGAEARKSLSAWTLNLQRAQVLALLLLIFTHIEDLLGGGGAEELWQLFSATSIGISWLLLLVLSCLGFAIVGRLAWLDILWALALLAAKSFSGHAASFSPVSATVTLDFIHLAAAALWAGGLLLLLVKWRKRSEETPDFVKAFSKMAFVSIIVLTLTGAASILLFLPGLHYLLYTTWGILMLVKIGAVLLVIVAGIVIRMYVRKRKAPQAYLWVKIDFALMAVIVILVGLITYMAPIPSNQPLVWHVMGDKVHMTSGISPKAQGTNTFETKVFLPEKAGKPKQVQMILHYTDDTDIAPIQIPLQPFADEKQEESYGFVKYSYTASGAYLPFRGNWDLEVRVMDMEDNETVYHKDFIVY